MSTTTSTSSSSTTHTHPLDVDGDTDTDMKMNTNIETTDVHMIDENTTPATSTSTSTSVNISSKRNTRAHTRAAALAADPSTSSPPQKRKHDSSSIIPTRHTYIIPSTSTSTDRIDWAAFEQMMESDSESSTHESDEEYTSHPKKKNKKEELRKKASREEKKKKRMAKMNEENDPYSVVRSHLESLGVMVNTTQRRTHIRDMKKARQDATQSVQGAREAILNAEPHQAQVILNQLIETFVPATTATAVTSTSTSIPTASASASASTPLSALIPTPSWLPASAASPAILAIVTDVLSAFLLHSSPLLFSSFQLPNVIIQHINHYVDIRTYFILRSVCHQFLSCSLQDHSSIYLTLIIGADIGGIHPRRLFGSPLSPPLKCFSRIRVLDIYHDDKTGFGSRQLEQLLRICASTLVQLTVAHEGFDEQVLQSMENLEILDIKAQCKYVDAATDLHQVLPSKIRSLSIGWDTIRRRFRYYFYPELFITNLVKSRCAQTLEILHIERIQHPSIDVEWSHLGELSRLHTLSIDQKSGPFDISAITRAAPPSLTSLSIPHYFSLESICTLPSLSKLTLSTMQYGVVYDHDLACLAGARHIQQLTLQAYYGNTFQIKLSFLRSWERQLTSLSLISCHLKHADFTILEKETPALTHLSFSDCSSLENNDISQLFHIPSLRHLSLTSQPTIGYAAFSKISTSRLVEILRQINHIQTEADTAANMDTDEDTKTHLDPSTSTSTSASTSTSTSSAFDTSTPHDITLNVTIHQCQRLLDTHMTAKHLFQRMIGRGLVESKTTYQLMIRNVPIPKTKTKIKATKDKGKGKGNKAAPSS